MKRLWLPLFCVVVFIAPAAAQNTAAPENGYGATTTTAALQNSQSTMAQQVTRNALLEWFQLGGPFMYLILALSVLALGITIERAIVFRSEKLRRLKTIGNNVIALLKKERLSAAAIRYLEGFTCNVCSILARGLKLAGHGADRVEKSIEAQAKLEVSLLESKLGILSAIGTTAPLLGFLGTVAGMINAFQKIYRADQVNAQVVAGGIYEALITTEFGLLIAIPVFFIANYFYHRIDGFASDIERISEEIINLKLTHEDKHEIH
jgi:biopolymer transport protein ExbB